MKNTQFAIWKPAFWLTLIFLAFGGITPAFADCDPQSAARSCCAAHPADCRCPVPHSKASLSGASQGGGLIAACPCRVLPAAPAPPALPVAPLFFDAAPVSLISFTLSIPALRGPPCAAAPFALRSACLRFSSPRAPPQRGERNSKKGSGYLHQRPQVRYQFIKEGVGPFSLSALCRVMPVCRSGYYAAVAIRRAACPPPRDAGLPQRLLRLAQSPAQPTGESRGRTRRAD